MKELGNNIKNQNSKRILLILAGFLLLSAVIHQLWYIQSSNLEFSTLHASIIGHDNDMFEDDSRTYLSIPVVFDPNYLSAHLMLVLEADDSNDTLPSILGAFLYDWNADQDYIIGYADPHLGADGTITAIYFENFIVVELVAYAVTVSEGEKNLQERRAFVGLPLTPDNILSYSVGTLHTMFFEREE